MSLPPIPLSPPLVIPAVPERTFPRLFMTDLNLTSVVQGAEARVYLRLQPVNDAGDTTTEGAQSYNIANIYAAAAAKPTIAAAMQAVIEAVPDLIAYAQENSDQ